MSISPRRGVRGLRRLPCLKYYNVRNGKSDTNSCRETFSVFVTNLFKNSTNQRALKNCFHFLQDIKMYYVQDSTEMCKLHEIVGRFTSFFVIVFFFVFLKIIVLSCSWNYLHFFVADLEFFFYLILSSSFPTELWYI